MIVRLTSTKGNVYYDGSAAADAVREHLVLEHHGEWRLIEWETRQEWLLFCRTHPFNVAYQPFMYIPSHKGGRGTPYFRNVTISVTIIQWFPIVWMSWTRFMASCTADYGQLSDFSTEIVIFVFICQLNLVYTVYTAPKEWDIRFTRTQVRRMHVIYAPCRCLEIQIACYINESVKDSNDVCSLVRGLLGFTLGNSYDQRICRKQCPAFMELST